MNKREFLLALHEELGDLTNDEKSAAIKYYSDYIDDAGEENFDKILAELGGPSAVAATILEDSGVSPKSNPVSQIKGFFDSLNDMPKWLLILIIVLLSPLWLTLFASAFSVVVGVFSVLLALFMSAFAITLSSLALLGSGLYTLIVSPTAGLFLIGIGVAVLGLSLILIMTCVFFLRTIIPFCIKYIKQLYNMIFKKGAK